MHTSTTKAFASATLGLLLAAAAIAAPAETAEPSAFAAAKTRAAESGKLVLIDFSAPN